MFVFKSFFGFFRYMLMNPTLRTISYLRLVLGLWGIVALIAGSVPLHLAAQTQNRYTQVLTSSLGTFRDRDGADRSRPYANNLNAFWLIKPTNPLGTKLIILRFDSLNTQRGTDLVRIFARDNLQRIDTAKPLAVYSGATLPNVLTISTNAVTVQFISDASQAGETRRDSATGWTITYSSFTNFTTATESVFSDREGATRQDGYQNDLDALWLIRPKDAKQILLQFDSLNIEEDYDFVSIIAGVQEPRIVARFTGSDLPPSFVVEDSIVVVRFTTDEDIVGNDDRFTSGWTVRYTSSTRATILRPDVDNLSFAPVNLGGDSPVQTLRLNGVAFLTDITVIAPEGFKVASSLTGVFSDTVRIITPKNSPDIFREQVFVRFSPKSAGDFSGRLTLRSGAVETAVTLTGLSKPAIFWESTGGPNSGQVKALGIAAGNVLLAGTRSGIYRSNSNGAVWLPSNTGLTAKGAQRVNFISIGRGRDTLAYISTEAGMFASADTGKTWVPIPRTGINTRAEIFSLLQFGGRLLAGTSYGIYQFSLLRRQWTPAMKGFEDEEAEVRSLVAHGNSIVAGTHGYGVYISDDSAATWRTANGDAIPEEDGYVVSGFASANGQLLAIVDAIDDDGYVDHSDVYRTSNNGESWGYEDLDSLYEYTGYYQAYSIVVANDVIYLGTNSGVARRRFVDGAPWNLPRDPSTVGFTEPTVEALTTNGSTLYAGTLAGVFRSNNQGVTWQAVNTGLTATRVYALGQSRGTILAGTEGSGVFRSADNGASWQVANNGLRGVYIGAFATQSDAVYTCTYFDRTTESNANNGVYRSLDNGLTWALTSKFPTSNTDPKPLSPQPDVWVISIDDRNALYAGASIGQESYLYASTTNGESWRAISLPSSALLYPIFAFEDGPGSGMYVGTYGGGAYWSQDPLGASPNWSRILFDNITDEEDYVRCFATFRDNLYVGTDAGLFRANSARTKWLPLENAPRQIKGETILSLHVSGGMLYAGTFTNGVWRSADGLTWERLNDGFATTAQDVYALGSDGINIYAGLDGNAIYRSSLSQSANQARAFLEVDDFYRAKPGDTIEIALKIGTRQNLPAMAAAQMPSASGVLRFNASLLEPVDEETRLQSVVSNGERLVNFRAQLKSDQQIRMTRDSVIKRFRFRALLGNSVATPLLLTNLSAPNVSILARRPGLFTLTGLSDAGGTRLFVAESKPVVAIAPNPNPGNFTVSVTIFDGGETTVTLSNLFGQTVRTILAVAELVPGDYDFTAALSDMPQGVYFLSVQTPTQRVVKQVQVVR